MKDWQGERVVIMGLARQGRALIDALAGRGAHVVATDIKSREELGGELHRLPESVEVHAGSHPFSLLEDAGAVFLSGGVPADLPFVLEARRRGIRVLNDSQLFLEEVRAPVIGITGSAGKSTTTSLVGHILSSRTGNGEARVWVGGNIGNPLICDLEQIREGDLVVMELSSFQLEIMESSPETAVMLNITPNHLDRHKTMGAYIAAKARILEFQSESDWAVLGWDDEDIRGLAGRVAGNLAGFGRNLEGVDGVSFDSDVFRLQWEGREAVICRTEESPLRGEHNLWNAAAAFTVCAIHGVEPEAMREALMSFQGLPHRLEEVGRKHGLLWVNDSIATTPERAAAALRSFAEPLAVLVGGKNKGLPWESFVLAANEHAEQVILFGEAAEEILASIEAECRCGVRKVDSLEEAVRKAAETAKKGRVVLLSPGCSSFDAYADYEERGAHFRELVGSL